MSKFVPNDFNPPEKTQLGDFLLRKLAFEDSEVDYKAVMSSADLIRKTRGGSWPPNDLTLEDNRIDLAWHQREFDYKSSFAYCAWDLEEKEYLGCVYFYKRIGFDTRFTAVGYTKEEK